MRDCRPDVTFYFVCCLLGLELLGDALRGSKDVADCVAEGNDEVIQCYEKAVALFREVYPEGHPDMLTGKSTWVLNFYFSILLFFFSKRVRPLAPRTDVLERWTRL